MARSVIAGAADPGFDAKPRAQAAKRIGALHVCLPDNISVKALGDRMADCGAKLVLTTAAFAPGQDASLKASVYHALCAQRQLQEKSGGRFATPSAPREV